VLMRPGIMIRSLQSMIVTDWRSLRLSWDWISSVFPIAEMIESCTSIAPSIITSREALTGMMVAWM
jgi:hypothetical protein